MAGQTAVEDLLGGKEDAEVDVSRPDPQQDAANSSRRDTLQGSAGRPLLNVSLAKNGGERDILGTGWCEAEPTGTWTGDAEVELRLPVPSGMGGYTLRLTAAPYQPARRPGSQRVLVLAGDQLLGRIRFDRLAVAEMAIPATLTARQSLLLSLVLPDARRPCELGESEDSRLLALFVSRIELVEAQARSDMPVVAPCPTDADIISRDRGPLQIGHFEVPERAPQAVPHPRALMEHFESLGWNAEFGFVQRRFLAEPASLLRWASAGGAALLAEALRAGLHGVGNPAQLSVEAQAGGWVALDRRWKFRVDVQLPLHTADRASLREHEAAAQAMQRDRLLEILRQGHRVLVYKERDPSDRMAAEALAAAVAGHGACWLLWVSRGPTLGVRRIGRRRLEGTLPRFAPFDNLGRVAAQDWLAICAEAWSLSWT